MNVVVLGAGPRGRVHTRRCVRAGHTVRLYEESANAMTDSVGAVAQAVDDGSVTDSVNGTVVTAGLQAPNRAVGPYFPGPNGGDVDRAATRTEAGRVPLARANANGLHAVLAGLTDLTERLGVRFEPPSLLRDAVAAGRFGQSTDGGFYVWTNGEPTRPGELDPTVDARADGVDER